MLKTAKLTAVICLCSRLFLECVRYCILYCWINFQKINWRQLIHFLIDWYFPITKSHFCVVAKAENQEHKLGLYLFTRVVELKMWLTGAPVSISGVSSVTGTYGASWSVSACGVRTTLGGKVFTLVNIYVIINSFTHSVIDSLNQSFIQSFI